MQLLQCPVTLLVACGGVSDAASDLHVYHTHWLPPDGQTGHIHDNPFRKVSRIVGQKMDCSLVRQ